MTFTFLYICVCNDEYVLNMFWDIGKIRNHEVLYKMGAKREQYIYIYIYIVFSLHPCYTEQVHIYIYKIYIYSFNGDVFQLYIHI